MRKTTFLKTFLVALGMLVGTSAWATVTETVVVNQDFNDGTTTLFTGVSRISVTNDNNAKFTCANNSQNGYSLATYNFSSAIGNDASAVKIEFAFWIPNQNAAYRRLFTVGQADLRTGFAQTAYSTKGSMFAFGLARNSSANYFSINGASTTVAASADGKTLGAWAHAEIYVDHSAKTVNYKITSMDGLTTYYSANNVAFVDGTASYCNQLDFFDCQNNTVSYLDNLVITKYKDDSKVATTYTVKYQNAGGDDLKDAVVYDTYVGDTYTASASDMATFYNGDASKKYVYVSGNTSTTATSTAASNVITLVFNEYSKVAYTVTAKYGEETLGTLASGNAYTDGSTTVYWNKFKNFSDQWYETTSTPYGKTITAEGNTDVEYAPSNIAYFFEMESLTRSGGAYLTETSTSYSNNARLRMSKGSLHYTPALAAGVYTLKIGVANSNSSASKVYIYTRSGEGVLSDVLHTHEATSGNTTINVDITVPEGYSIAFNGDEGGSYNNNARMDYMTLTPKVSQTIAAAGWASLFTPYALDFSGVTGLTAYTATVSGTTVTLTKVENVPANTGVVLKGAANTYVIPVITSSTTAQGDLKGSTTDDKAYDTSYDYYYLALNGSNAKFKKLTSGSIAAGKAYLQLTPSAARELSIVFDDETTGIHSIDNGKLTIDNSVYDLSGRRVAKPTKGLYIVNGKKVAVK